MRPMMSSTSDNSSKSALSHSHSGSLQGQRSVFRVSSYRHSGIESSRKAEKRVYHARRSHPKSRGGCAKCKARRLKCDETKPHCLRCQKHGTVCSYESQTNSKHEKDIVTYLIEKVPSLASPDSNAYSMSLSAVSEKIRELLKLSPKGGNLSNSLRALHHFQQHTIPTVGNNDAEGLLGRKVIQLALDSPFLLHAVIGSATTHLCYIVPDNSSFISVEAYHWQKAIGQYSQEISRTGSHNMDTLFSACILMTLHTFRLETYNPRSSFVFSDNPNSLNWLMLQSGLRHLLGLTRPWLPTSMFYDMFMKSRNETPLFDDKRPGREGLDPAFADICGIDETSTEETNPYMWPLRMLMPLLSAERSIRSFNMYVNFMGRLLTPFYDRLVAKDPPALLILAWWLSLVDSVHLWWMETRVKSECVAICTYLEYSDDPRILALLEFPAEVSGYSLRHVEEKKTLMNLSCDS